MSTQLGVKIHASKTYLALSIGVYLLGIFSAWAYFYSVWLSLVVSAGFSIWLFYFLPKLQLTHPKSIVKISLEKDKLVVEKNDHSTQQYSVFHCEFQSRFLVIINAGKESIVIFKDALTAASLSQINKYFNANT
ncbi:hypothetical protein MNB_SUP05-SYMBIONT-5-942 [hydrothermal vent metagenome]|uniref:Uncharacterized protein n=1 Tax=hydrothermal vent metagenome TaxID=652676 RepID=A0A1W1E663_9ZZZZ